MAAAPGRAELHPSPVSAESQAEGGGGGRPRAICSVLLLCFLAWFPFPVIIRDSRISVCCTNLTFLFYNLEKGALKWHGGRRTPL